MRNSTENPDFYQNVKGTLSLRLISDSSFEITEKNTGDYNDQEKVVNSSGIYHVSSNDEITQLMNETASTNVPVDEKVSIFCQR